MILKEKIFDSENDGPFRCCLNIVKSFMKKDGLIPLVLNINERY